MVAQGDRGMIGHRLWGGGELSGVLHVTLGPDETLHLATTTDWAVIVFLMILFPFSVHDNFHIILGDENKSPWESLQEYEITWKRDKAEPNWFFKLAVLCFHDTFVAGQRHFSILLWRLAWDKITQMHRTCWKKAQQCPKHLAMEVASFELASIGRHSEHMFLET